MKRKKIIFAVVVLFIIGAIVEMLWFDTAHLYPFFIGYIASDVYDRYKDLFNKN